MKHPTVLVIVLLTLAFGVGQSQAQKSHYPIYEVGGDVTPPRPTSTPVPAPPDTVKTHLLVRVSFVVEPDGSVTGIRLLKRSKTDFDEYAAKVVSSWKFDPAMKEGKAVAVRLVTELRAHND